MCEKSENPKEIEEKLKRGIKRDTRLAWTLVWLGVALALIGVVFVCSFRGATDTTALSRLDSYSSYLQGAVGSIWTLAGFVLIYVAFLGQKLQLLQQEVQIQEQKQQFENEKKDQQQEIAEQRKQFALQHESIKRQNFENTFFQLLNLQQQIVTSIRNRMRDEADQGDRHFKKSEAFQMLIEKFGDIFSKSTEQALNAEAEVESKGAKGLEAERILWSEHYYVLYKHHEADLSHYFRNLYHIFKFVNSAEVLKNDDPQIDLKNRRQYTSLARAQLSGYELALLFYNALTPIPPETTNKFKPLIEKFGLLENLNPQLLLKKEHKQFYSPSAYADFAVTH